MKKVFIDTNVFIDYVARRAEFYTPAATIVGLAAKGHFCLLVSSLAFATASYVLEKHYKMSTDMIMGSYQHFMTLAHITVMDENTVKAAIETPFDDFEDAMQYHSAMAATADCIVTRNKSDFTKSTLEVYEPKEFLDMLLTQNPTT